MASYQFLLKQLLLPHLKLIKAEQQSLRVIRLYCQKTTDWEVCRKCPTKSYQVHDSREVRILDTRLKNKSVILVIRKRRFRCPCCNAVFTEMVPGIKHRYRTTERFREQVMRRSVNYNNLSLVAKRSKISETLVGNICYPRMELALRKSKNTPWGSTISMDEHGLKKGKYRKEFVVPFVDIGRRCVRELAHSTNHVDMKQAIEHIPGKENVNFVVMDLSRNFRLFATEYFPNAKIVADKFHVLHRLSPAIRKYRKEITGDKRTNPIRWLLLKNYKDLECHQKRAVAEFCRIHTKVGEVYAYKERLHGFYRIKGYKQARRVLGKLLDDMAHSKIKEIQTLRKTLLSWHEEILRYFGTGLTNARIEGFNRKCKLIQRKAYGFKSFKNYRLRVLFETM